MPTTEIYVADRIPLADDTNWLAYGANANDHDGRISALIAEFQTRAKYHGVGLSYIRVDDSEPIDVGASFDTLRECCAIAFKNSPNDQWWFGAITRVQYISDGVTRIHWKEDIFNNWWRETTYGQQYVVREHTNDDTIGANTEPENVELGPYVTTATTSLRPTVSGGSPDICGIVMATERCPGQPAGTFAVPNCPNTNYHPPGFYGGVFSPYFWYQTFPDTDGTLEEMRNVIGYYVDAGKENAIIGVYMQPRNLYAIDSAVNVKPTVDNINKDTPVKTQIFSLAPRTLSYTPQNNKLYTFPYVCCVLSNLSDNSVLQYEMFSSSYTAVVSGGFGMDAYAFAAPNGYGGKRVDNARGVQIGGWPLLSWTGNVFARWVAQNRGKTTASLINTSIIGAARLAAGDLIGGYGTLGAAAVSTVGAVHDQQIMPNNSYGAKNAQNVLSVTNQLETTPSSGQPCALGFYSFCQCIRPEYMQLIDDHFTRLGYATNRIKWPNFYGRKAFNFVQIANPTFRGAVPDYVRQYFQTCFAKGVTLWHNGAIGDYSQDNGIKS